MEWCQCHSLQLGRSFTFAEKSRTLSCLFFYLFCFFLVDAVKPTTNLHAAFSFFDEYAAFSFGFYRLTTNNSTYLLLGFPTELYSSSLEGLGARERFWVILLDSLFLNKQNSEKQFYSFARVTKTTNNNNVKCTMSERFINYLQSLGYRSWGETFWCKN